MKASFTMNNLFKEYNKNKITKKANVLCYGNRNDFGYSFKPVELTFKNRLETEWRI